MKNEKEKLGYEMKHKRIIIIAVVLLASVVLLCYVLSVQKLLNDYKTGFRLYGTYQSFVETVFDDECLVFVLPEGSERNVFYYYRQFGLTEKGTYAKIRPNLYKLDIEDSEIDGNYILVGNKCIYLIKSEGVSEFKKTSDTAGFINVEAP